MTTSTINHFIELLNGAFRSMAVTVPLVDTENLAMLIHQSMDHDRRIYHTSSHLFELCQGMNPWQTIAALFHDIVYYQLDKGFPRCAQSYLQDVVEISGPEIRLRPFAENDVALTLCSRVFGFRAGDVLPLYGGLNEFLSAVLALKLLQAYLPLKSLMAIAACIEATLPFRGPDQSGVTFPERLAVKISQAAEAIGLVCSEDECAAMVTDAVILANRDVMSFSVDDPGNFLSTTWMLIEESNAPMNAISAYSIQEYRIALQRMAKFLGNLHPETIFHSFRNVPGKEEMALLHQAAKRNIAFAIDYMDAKIVGIAVIEALALLTGGDCSVSMFLGDIRGKQGKPPRADHFLPPLHEVQAMDADLMRVLEFGRTYDSTNDLTSSPITAYLCRHMGPDGMKQALQEANKMFGGAQTPKQFLDRLNPQLVKSVAQACNRIALSRSPMLVKMFEL